ncbi:MAG: SpoIID/LytB domain-containing protein [Vicinamibacterales bacterium]
MPCDARDDAFKNTTSHVDTWLSRTAWIALSLLVWTAACAPRPRPTPTPPSPPAAPTLNLPPFVRVQVHAKGGASVVVLPLETYVTGVILGEVSVPAADRQFAATTYGVQAVLARTYAAANLGRHLAAGFDLCDETHCQVYRPPGPSQPEWRRSAANAATIATTGRVLTFDGRPIQALYHAHCGGHTSAAAAVWGGAPVPYLGGVDDPYCLRQPSVWTSEIALDRLRVALNASNRTRIGARLTGIAVEARDASGLTTRVRLEGDDTRTVRGEELRSSVAAALGASTLRSPKFTVVVRRGRAIFSGTGSGHGAGLCQTGALERVKDGADLDSVLAAYYPGATLTPLRRLPSTTLP